MCERILSCIFMPPCDLWGQRSHGCGQEVPEPGACQASSPVLYTKGHHENDRQRLRRSSCRAVFSLNAMPAEDSFQYFHCSVKNITEKRSAVLFFVLSCIVWV